MRGSKRERRFVMAAAIASAAAVFPAAAFAAEQPTPPVCADPAVRARVFEAVTGGRAPADGSRFALLGGKWEIGDPAKAFGGSAAGPSIVVSAPVTKGGDVRAAIARSQQGRALGVHFCEYRVPASVTDWSKASFSQISAAASWRFIVDGAKVGTKMGDRFRDLESRWSDARVFAAVIIPQGAGTADRFTLTLTHAPTSSGPVPAGPPSTAGDSLGAEVLAAANGYPNGGGYCWTDCGTSSSGTSKDIVLTTSSGHPETILTKDPNHATYCSGFTFMVATDVIEKHKLARSLAAADLERFQTAWYGAANAPVSYGGKSVDEDTVGEHQAGAALALFGLGAEVSADQSAPGDFVEVWSTTGHGHSAVVVRHLVDAGGKKVGVEYRSSQSSSSPAGIGNRIKCYSDSASDPQCKSQDATGIRSRTYFARIIAR